MMWTTAKPKRLIAATLLLVFLTGGCINSTTRDTPEDTSVRELLQERDCVVSIFGISFRRTPSIERAKLEGYPIKDPDGSLSSISKIRLIEFTDDSFLLGSHHCVAVVGE